MVLKECYYVCYYVADFSKDGESVLHEDPYRVYSNALTAAKELTKCLDVVDGNACIVSGLTGEVLAEFSAAFSHSLLKELQCARGASIRRAQNYYYTTPRNFCQEIFCTNFIK